MRDGGEWKLWKCVEEPEFGPGLTIHTVYIMGKLLDGNQILQGLFMLAQINFIIEL